MGQVETEEVRGRVGVNRGGKLRRGIPPASLQGDVIGEVVTVPAE